MQHPDEGTIHAWLDGALDAGEAARLEAHVAECAECAAAVAEARGLVAAASRILGALDDVPAGVTTLGRAPVPMRAPRRPWYARPALRAAAALLVVAGGTTLVMRSGFRPERSSAKAAAEFAAAAPARDVLDSAASPATAASASAPVPPAAAPAATPAPAGQAPAPRTIAGTGSARPADAASFATGAAAEAATKATGEESRRVASVAGGAGVAESRAATSRVAAPRTADARDQARRTLSTAPAGATVAQTPPPPVETPRSARVATAPTTASADRARTAAEMRADSLRAGVDSARSVARARADTIAADLAAPAAPRPAFTPPAAPGSAMMNAARARTALVEHSPAVVAALAGCHAVTLGAWAPAAVTKSVPGAGPAAAGALPQRVLLDTTLAPDPMAYGLALRAAPGAAAGAYRLAYWTPLAAGAARLVWAAGPATVDARVSRVPGEDGVLRGTATWMAGGAGRSAPAWQAPIELARVRCVAR